MTSLWQFKWRKLIIGVLFLLGLVQFTILPAQAAGQVWQSFTSKISQSLTRFYLRTFPGQKDGTAVLKQSLLASQNIKTFYLSTNLGVEATDDSQGSLASLGLTVAGQFNSQEALENGEVQQDLKVAGEIKQDGTSMAVDVDLKQENKDTLYVKVNQLPAIPFLDTTKIKNQWLKFVSPATEEAAAEPTVELSADKIAQLEQLTMDLLSSSAVSPAVKTEANGQKVFQVTVTITDPALITYLVAVDQLFATADSPATLDSGSLQDTLNRISDLEFTMLVDRSTFYPVQVEAKTSLDLATMIKEEESLAAGSTSDSAADSDLASPLSSMEQMPGANFLTSASKLTFSIKGEFSRFDEPINFEAPANALDGEEILKEAMQSYFSQMMPGLSFDPATQLPAGNDLILPGGDAAGSDLGDEGDFEAVFEDLSPEEIQQIQEAIKSQSDR